MSDTSEVVCKKVGSVGSIVLNRPKALNALSRSMVQGMAEALHHWKEDPQVKSVVVKGAGEKAFCAGGDVRSLRQLCLDGKREEALAFWYEEYTLNAQIKHFSKPYISLIGGIVMGGGVGISLHGSYRIGGENYLFAMPEVGIGFFPDVGAAFPLSRLPSRIGTYLAITGDRLKRDDALYLGLLTHAVDSSNFECFENRLSDGEELDVVLAELAMQPGQSKFERDAGLIEHCFSADDVKTILKRLEESAKTSEFARHILSTFSGKSPTSMCIAFEQMRRAQSLDFDAVVQMDYRLSSRLCEDGEDFFEGVRALLVDKDGNPSWKPATLDQIDNDKIQAYFAPLTDREFEVL